ncbi:MAG: hypothetical protein FRX49_09592 [Trebouxia sp. A1-2]|nr:MAG: hypothetical protein FRX49_09592 [Trebouxia sp. A1-2]
MGQDSIATRWDMKAADRAAMRAGRGSRQRPSTIPASIARPALHLGHNYICKCTGKFQGLAGSGILLLRVYVSWQLSLNSTDRLGYPVNRRIIGSSSLFISGDFLLPADRAHCKSRQGSAKRTSSSPQFAAVLTQDGDLSERAQELAGVGKKGQRMAQLALQHQGKPSEAN